ncbi:MAG: hypothetical protein ACXWQO_17320, partial [Bdellovibrionota bacterium]
MIYLNIKSPGLLLPSWRMIAGIALPLLACLMQLVFWPILKPQTWALFYPAIFFSTAFGGHRIGLFATAISAMLGWY